MSATKQGTPQPEAHGTQPKKKIWRLIGDWFLAAFLDPSHLPQYLIAVFAGLLVLFAWKAWTEAQNGTHALEDQLAVAQRTFFATTRPWLKPSSALHVKSVAVLEHDKRVLIVAGIPIKNIGHSPANSIFVGWRPPFEDTHIFEGPVCGAPDARPKPAGPARDFIFPGDELRKPDALFETRISEQKSAVYTIPVCIYYLFDGSPDVHGTSLVFFVSKLQETV